MTLLCGSAVAQTSSCFTRSATAKPDASVRQVNATVWSVNVPGFATVAKPSTTTKHCAVGILVPTGTSITAASLPGVFNSSTGGELVAFQFAANTTVGTNFGTGFRGSLAKVTAAVAAGPATFNFGLQVTSGTTAATFKADLKKVVLAVQDATSTGTLTGKRIVVPIANISDEDRAFNEQILHNGAHTDAATRRSTTLTARVWYMQPAEFRKNQGAASGFRGVFQDGNQATAEVVDMGFVKESTTTAGEPDITAAGELARVRVTLFGSGTGGAAFQYTVSNALNMPLPAKGQFGVFCRLPAPHPWPSDAATVHAQIRTPAVGVPIALRKQRTWGELGTGKSTFGAAGSTLRFGGLYDRPVQQAFSESTAYQATAEKLYGVESIFPNPGRTTPDKVGVTVRASRFGGGVSVTLLSLGYSPVPIPILSWGNFLIGGTLPISLPTVLGATGSGSTPGLLIPAKVVGAAQNLALTTSGKVLLTNAAMVRAQ